MYLEGLIDFSEIEKRNAALLERDTPPAEEG
jgi:hypothetical protein